MKIDIQSTLFNLIKEKIGPSDSIGSVLPDILNLSQDAIYRRLRGDTPLDIYELQKICQHFGISFDALLEIDQHRVTFDYNSLLHREFSLDTYLTGILDGLKKIKSLPNSHLIMVIDDTPIMQMMNFPHLVRFKLFYWAKSYLNVKEYQDKTFDYEKISDATFQIGKEILQVYNSIPSKEIYDLDFMRGYLREIQYYFDAYLFQDSNYAIKLMDEMQLMMGHLKAQIAIGKKFIYGTQAPASGNHFEVYLNDTANVDSTYYYESNAKRGVYFIHNMMNYLHTSDVQYTLESESIIQNHLQNSSLISGVNERQRNGFFHQLEKSIQAHQQKMQNALTF